MRRVSLPFFRPAKLARILNIPREEMQAIIWFKNVNGLVESGALVRHRGNVYYDKERFLAWYSSPISDHQKLGNVRE